MNTHNVELKQKLIDLENEILQYQLDEIMGDKEISS